MILVIILAAITPLVQAGSAGFCTSDEFKCLDGTCIGRQLLCDGKKNCPDSSDEVFSACYNETCTGFRCNYGGCINRNLICNNVTNCWDESDENEFLCANDSRKLELFMQLKGDCPGEYGMQCPNSHKCLEWSEVCDGVSDCNSGEDENLKLCGSSRCPYDSFQCESGGCIHKNRLCNKNIDCVDGSDEIPNICLMTQVVYSIEIKDTDNQVQQSEQMPEITVWQSFSCPLVLMPGMQVLNFFSQLAYKSDDEVPHESIVEVTCNDTYILFGSNINKCVNNMWHNEWISCVRYCEPSPDARRVEYSAMCSRKSNIVDCNEIPHQLSTELLVPCSAGYESDSGHDQVGRHICNEQGEWTVVEENPICVPICGVKSAQHPDITPWTVSLFRRSTGKYGMYTFRCIGTILSPYIVITANACFSEADEVNSHLFFKIAEGNHKINFTEDEDHGYVLHNLMEIHLGSFDKNHMAAILSLVKPFRFGGLVRPVCLAPSYDETQPMEIKGIFDSAELGKGHTEYENSKYYLTYFVASESLKYSVRSFISSIKDYISKSEQVLIEH
ncbi:modular serine protease-like [Drosophila hydei]|uniref:Modular serine protease-like n=1 Tax=Drosophila hydei TaxID=7224 RepID=A0A6J2T001_DROHY|nr:modular serine protease-like [Drosophila hydei]